MAVILIAGISLAACASNTSVLSLKGGACEAFDAPQYAVKGKTSYDQRWVNGQVEAGVGACNWQRPKARPVSLDAPKAPKAGQNENNAPTAISGPPKPPKKARFRDRLKKLIGR